LAQEDSESFYCGEVHNIAFFLSVAVFVAAATSAVVITEVLIVRFQKLDLIFVAIAVLTLARITLRVVSFIYVFSFVSFVFSPVAFVFFLSVIIIIRA
jgi:hypothetical protein